MTRKDFIGGLALGAAGAAIAAPAAEAGGLAVRPALSPDACEFDIVVVGGSCTGVFAAIRAASNIHSPNQLQLLCFLYGFQYRPAHTAACAIHQYCYQNTRLLCCFKLEILYTMSMCYVKMFST